MSDLIAGIETGGTKVICVIAARDDARSTVRRAVVPTSTPRATLDAITSFLSPFRGQVRGIGLAAFGPLDVEPTSDTFGHVLSTPKVGWTGADVLGPIRASLGGAPAGLVTDVSGAALGEGRWGAAAEERDFVYITVGTGVGAGIVLNGAVLAGIGWPEIAHSIVQRHPDDHFIGTCRFHRDCLEGLASGPAVQARWHRGGSDLDPVTSRRNIQHLSFYLAQLIANLAYTLGVRFVILGGGVAKTPGLIAAVEQEVERRMGQPGANGTSGGRVRVLPPALGDDAGVLGALSLAQSVLSTRAVTESGESA